MKNTLLALLLLLPAGLSAQRQTLSLNGVWEIDESLGAGDIPAAFRHKAPVPGLANLAEPAFPDVDRFDSFENIRKKVRLKALPESAMIATVGVPRQNRNYFWYRTSFRAPAKKETAVLKVNKAQFGTAVWLNGRKIGEYLGCFTAGYFHLTQAIQWQGENTLIVRIGAHPAALPETAPAGTDNEKLKWSPGIYDAVSVFFADNPVIESVQVAPRLATSEIVVQTKVTNHGKDRSFALRHKVADAPESAEKLTLKAGETRTVVRTLKLANPKLWTPETPHLYTIETSTGGDTLATRFGMREFRFDTATKRAYLNGRPYFLRGSNITLHRFFEDPACRRLPWDEKWVRKLLTEIPKRLSWNSFRFCIGPVPDLWLDIADEAGLLIQNEFFVWEYRDQWDTEELARQYTDWMRDNWNHPSQAIWDASNETRSEKLMQIIERVRGLDLSNRPWENGYNLPAGPDDPVEDHPYLFSRLGRGFEIPELERMTGAKTTNSPHPTGHPVIINEYGWLWLNRDGTPTELTKDVYARLLGPIATAGQRAEAYAYYLGGLTEFWRAHRNAAGVLHFVYLTVSYPGGYTSDHFRDVESLRLEPNFEDYIAQAFKPLGVYLNFWQPKLPAGAERSFAVMMVNDESSVARGRLALSLVGGGGREVAAAQKPFLIPALGQQTYQMTLRVPDDAGEYWIKATAYPEVGTPTLSRRKFTVEKR
ncbi:MAG: beta galactosidase jelly roll domain-containing protein [Acidobacteria bacterium]|nr:beta galactosidase jelly roll domain-containing protein [Acidobacteriota bacterium]